MRRILLPILVLACTGVGPVAATLPDWHLFVVDVLEDAEEIWLRGTGGGVGTGAGPQYEGTAIGLPTFDFFNVELLGGGPVELVTSEGLASVRTEVLAGEGLDFGYSVSFGLTGGLADAGERYAFLLFMTNTELEIQWDPIEIIGGAAVTVRQEYGTGSTTIPLVTPSTQGYAGSAGPVVAGSIVQTANSEVGIVGALDTSICWTCTMSSSAPDDWPESYARGVAVQVGHTDFAGPGGQWRWQYKGFGYAAPSETIPLTAGLGAYAPIGDDWALFRFERPPLLPV
jgi:hypothetical protein